MKHDETKRLKQILTSSGKLVNDLGIRENGEVRDIHLELPQMKTTFNL